MAKINNDILIEGFNCTGVICNQHSSLALDGQHIFIEDNSYRHVQTVIKHANSS